MERSAEQYARLIAILECHDAVVGAWLGGSRGKGYHDAHSDYDLAIIVRDDVAVPAVEYAVAEREHGDEFDVGVTTLADLGALAWWGRSDSWKRYAFADTRAALDKTGEVQEIIDRIGRLPRRHTRALIRNNLDAYLNATYRSTKAQRRGKEFAARLDCAHAVEHLLVALFALHGHLKPYNDYLDREIDRLHLLGDRTGRLIARLSDLLDEADPQGQHDLREEMDRLFRTHGFGAVFDSWHDHWRSLTHAANGGTRHPS